MKDTIIVGAGLAGLLAAHAWPNFKVLEAAPAPRAMHKALLRFRTDSVSKLTGIEFRKVLVRKNIWSRGRFVEPNIELANRYSMKTLNRIVGDRSIWNLSPVERYIAPETFYEQLVEAVGPRISWDCPVAAAAPTGPLISTIPLPSMLEMMDIPAPFTFERAPIEVHRYRLRDTDVHQTCYYPDDGTQLYRASITGDLLIAEFAAVHGDNPVKVREDAAAPVKIISESFGINMDKAQPLGVVEQRYGKIAPIEDAARKRLLFKLTHDCRIFSLGRFAVWRNILLDDVVDDIAVIRKLMRSSSYDIHRAIG
jgi:hypothetical protein